MSSQGHPKTGGIIRAFDAVVGAIALAKAKQQSLESTGQRIARLRKDKGITQKELADLLDVTQSVVSDYENDALRLHGELIIQLCEILRCTADELLGLNKAAKDKNNATIKNRRLFRRLQQIEQLPKRDQDALFRTIDAFLSKAS